MKTFWWFHENQIAGMARPGFNSMPWFKIPFVEAQLLGWLGQHSSGHVDLESFRHHLKTYVPKIMKFYGLDTEAGRRELAVFDSPSGLADVLGRMADRTGLISRFEVFDGGVHVEFCPVRLSDDIEGLRSRGVSRVVSLTEKHHSRDELARHFTTHHIAIDDLGAPTVDQVHELASILSEARSGDEIVAVHCLAGIGRTSTMLMGAHIVMGSTLTEMEELIARQNPNFVLTGVQADFIRSLAAGR